MWHINVSTPQLLQNNFSTYSNTVVRKKFFLTKPFDCKTWITVSLGGISHFSKLQLISEGRLTISKDFKTQLVDKKIHQPHNLILRCNNTIRVLPESNKNLFLKQTPPLISIDFLSHVDLLIAFVAVTPWTKLIFKGLNPMSFTLPPLSL